MKNIVIRFLFLILGIFTVYIVTLLNDYGGIDENLFLMYIHIPAIASTILSVVFFTFAYHPAHKVFHAYTLSLSNQNGEIGSTKESIYILTAIKDLYYGIGLIFFLIWVIKAALFYDSDNFSSLITYILHGLLYLLYATAGAELFTKPLIKKLQIKCLAFEVPSPPR